MELTRAIIYGLIQGLTEFLPISSSGHLAIVEAVFKEDAGIAGGDALSFSVLLHLGTLFAVIAVYRKDIGELIRSAPGLFLKLIRGRLKFRELEPCERTLICLIISTLPLIPAAMLEDRVAYISTRIVTVGALLMINAAMLFAADRMKSGKTDGGTLGVKQALTVGLSQVFALLPGLSRSGTTTTVGLSQGFDRDFAVKYSFLMSIPAVAGACILDLPDFIGKAAHSGDSKLLAVYFAGALTAALTGICAIKLLALAAKRKSFKYFALYCAAVGIAAAVYGAINR